MHPESLYENAKKRLPRLRPESGATLYVERLAKAQETKAKKEEKHKQPMTGQHTMYAR